MFGLSGGPQQYDIMSALKGLMSGGSSLPGTMGPTDTWAPGASPGNMPILPAGYNTGASTGPAGATSGMGTEIGVNTGTGQLALGGLQTLGNLWNAYQSSSLANKAFNFNRDLANTNLSNQTQAYNTNLSGQADARFAQENKSPAQALDFFNAHKLASKTL
jgi:hypothetical protein